jgi:hypothetical protein
VVSENERPETGTPLTRRELRELERNRALAASAELAELATTGVPSPADPAESTVRQTWQPPAVPTSTGPTLSRRELRQRNVEVEPVRLSVPSQQPAPALEAPGTASAPPEVAPIEVAAVRDHAEDPGHLPVSRPAAGRTPRRPRHPAAWPSRPARPSGWRPVRTPVPGSPTSRTASPNRPS